MTQKRIVNFEVLRVISMLCIIIWHFYFYNIIYKNPKSSLFVDLNSAVSVFNFIISEALMSFVGIGVNCFVMITGYFLISNTKFKMLKVETIWFQTFFYSILIFVVASLFNPAIFSIKQVLEALFVIKSNHYWFVGNYLFLLLLSPFISKLLMQLSHKEYVILLLIMTLVCVKFPYNDVFKVSNGYSLIWFVYLYMVSGYVRLFNPFKKNCSKLFLVSILLSFVLNLYKCIIFNDGLCLRYYMNVSYNSIVFFVSIFFFIWIKNQTFKGLFWLKLSRTAPYMFGVYLIHEDINLKFYIWDLLSRNFLVSTPFLILIILVLCIIILIFSVIVDWSRYQIFRAINIDKLFNLLNQRILCLVHKVRI